MVALEAAERGRAAIVSDVGGLPEIVADGETGTVVPAGDSAALARAIVVLARDGELVRQYSQPADSGWISNCRRLSHRASRGGFL